MSKAELLMADRQKYWEELTADEKIERLASLVEHQQNQIQGFMESLSKLEMHSHQENGEIVVPMRWQNYPSGHGLYMRLNGLNRDPKNIS